MSMEQFSKGLSQDFYAEGRNYRGPQGQKLSEIQWFGWKAKEAGWEPDTKTLDRRTDEICEQIKSLQPNPNAPLTPTVLKQARELAEDTSAMWEVFEKAQIDPYSEHSPTVGELDGLKSKAFGTTSIEGVFPIFYQTQVMIGLLARAPLETMIAATTQTNGMNADHIGLTDTTTQRRLGESGEFARGTEQTLSYTNARIALKKFQGALISSDEARRAARINIFAIASQRVGEQLGIDVFNFGLDVLLGGDGTTLGPAITAVAVAVPGTPAYADFIAHMFAYTDGYEVSDALGHAQVLSNILLMSQFQDPMAGFNFQRTGQLPTPLGWNLHRWDSLDASNYAATQLITWQRNRALVQYNWGGIEQETERAARNGFDTNILRFWTGFSIWDRAASRKGTGWHS